MTTNPKRNNMKIIYLLFFMLFITAGCVNRIDDDETENKEENLISFSVDYNMTNIDAVKTKASGNLESHATNLMFYDYVDGEKVQEKSYTSSDADYGHIDINLSKGTHRLVFVGHNSDLANFDYPNLSFDKVKDTFTHSFDLTVDSETDPEQSVILSRSIGKILITATDAIPDQATGLRVTVNTYYPSFNVASGEASGVVKEEIRTFTYTEANKGVKNSTYTIYCFANKEKYTTGMTIDLLGTDDKVLYSNSLIDVPVKRNTQTKITGALFSLVAWGSIAIQSEWDDDIVYPI